MLLDQLVADITAPIIHGDLASGSASFALQWIIKIRSPKSHQTSDINKNSFLLVGSSLNISLLLYCNGCACEVMH